MSLLANIDHLAAAKGIVALCVAGPNAPRQFRGVDTWNPVLEGAISLLELTDESTIRLVIGKHTMVVQKELGETVAVVLPTGHAIAKSLRRMIRRMAKKDRGPYVPEDMDSSVSAAPSDPAKTPTSPPAPLGAHAPVSPAQSHPISQQPSRQAPAPAPGDPTGRNPFGS
ncbi:MAG: hypothetical protein R3A51_08230 [Nannocystaceae bacterium]|nr:hypothetical protein [Myxococcales bacterium]